MRRFVNETFDMLMGLPLYEGSPTAELTYLRVSKKILMI